MPDSTLRSRCARPSPLHPLAGSGRFPRTWRNSTMSSPRAAPTLDALFEQVRNMKRRFIGTTAVLAIALCAGAVALAGPAVAQPQTYQWIGSTGGGDGHSWTDQMNW